MIEQQQELSRHLGVARAAIVAAESIVHDSQHLQGLEAPSLEENPRKGIQSVDDIEHSFSNQMISLTKSDVFGGMEPSIEYFKQFIENLAGTTDTTYNQKRNLCKTINFWKKELGLQLSFDGVPCSLKACTTRNDVGTYQLRSLGNDQNSLNSSIAFPLLSVEPKTFNK